MAVSPSTGSSRPNCDVVPRIKRARVEEPHFKRTSRDVIESSTPHRARRGMSAFTPAPFARGARETRHARSPRAPRAHRSRVVTARAGKVDKDGASFVDWLKKEIDLTFNPRTPGAKIAGRCPDTQTQPSEVSKDAMSEEEDASTLGGDFDLRAFTAALERAMVEGGDNDEGAMTLTATKSVSVVQTEVVDDASMLEEDEDEDDGFEYELDGASEGPLTGRELALLCIKKYGKAHDMAIKHVKMGSGMKRWVSLNLYVGHLGQRSYPQTEAEYLEQLDVIAYLINTWSQADYTRAFFREKPIARRGLPSRPRVDTCVTLQFARSPTWDDELGDEFFPY